MRFLDTHTGQFVEMDPEDLEEGVHPERFINKKPYKLKYAILSHTWNEMGEQTYQELRRIQEKYAWASLAESSGARPSATGD